MTRINIYHPDKEKNLRYLRNLRMKNAIIFWARKTKYIFHPQMTQMTRINIYHPDKKKNLRYLRNLRMKNAIIFWERKTKYIFHPQMTQMTRINIYHPGKEKNLRYLRNLRMKNAIIFSPKELFGHFRNRAEPCGTVRSFPHSPCRIFALSFKEECQSWCTKNAIPPAKEW